MIRNELEHCVLGVIRGRGPCSAYVVRGEFEKSPSAYWSASTGSIYPVVKRLEALGMVGVGPQAQSGRRQRLLTITRKGEEALREWILRLDREATAATYDPVRTRMLFLDALPAEGRSEMIALACGQTQERLRELALRRAAVEGEGETLEAMATRGAEHELRARLAWLREIEAEAAQPTFSRRS